MKYLFGFLLFITLNLNAATGSREDDVLLYGGGILVLGLILGMIYLVSFIRRKIREYKRKVTEES